MTVDRDSLRAAYPEWTDAADALVDSAIARAQHRIDDAAYGDDLYDDAVTLYACHLLWISPAAAALRVVQVGGSGGDLYLEEFEALSEVAGRADREIP